MNRGILTCLIATVLSGFAGGDSLRGGDPSTSLVANGGFEIDANDDAWPDGWGKPKSGGSRQSEAGNHFLRLASTQPGEMVLLFQPIKLPAEVRALELAWRWRIADLQPGRQAWHDARIMLDFRDAAGNKLAGGPSAPYTRKNTDGWTERSVQFLVPPGATTLELMPTLFEVAAGTFDLDDVTLRPVDAVPLEAAAKIAAEAKAAKQAKDAAARQAKAAALLASTGSLVTNGDFEHDGDGKKKQADGKPDDWGLPKSGGWLEEEGNHFLRLTSDQPGETVLVYRQFDLPADVKALELSWRWRVTDLKPGREPWFDARILMNFKDAAGKKMPSSPPPAYTRSSTKGWVEKSVRFVVPDGALSLEFMPSLFQVERGTLDLDDVALQPTDAESLLAEAARKAELDRLANVPPEPPNPSKWPAELHVAGNRIVGPDGVPVTLQGVNVVSLEFLVRGDHVLRSIQVAVDDWHANIIRLPVKESYWFGRESGQKDGGAAYRELVDAAITMAANRGAYVLLDLHRFRAPRAEHVEFWRDAAMRYKNHPALLFDLFNEPHGMNWQTWRDGGFVEEKKQPADEDAFLSEEEKARAKHGFLSVGMQKLVDAVRDVGAKNIVVCGGLDWAYDLSGIAAGYALEERGGRGIVYSTHIYPWKRDWAGKVLCVADKHPVLVGEVGCDVKKMDFIPAEAQEDPYTWAPDMLGFLQKHDLNWTAFSFHPAATPVMITGWDYTPTPFWGAYVKRALAGEKFEMKKMR